MKWYSTIAFMVNIFWVVSELRENKLTIAEWFLNSLIHLLLAAISRSINNNFWISCIADEPFQLKYCFRVKRATFLVFMFWKENYNSRRTMWLGRSPFFLGILLQLRSLTHLNILLKIHGQCQSHGYSCLDAFQNFFHTMLADYKCTSA